VHGTKVVVTPLRHAIAMVSVQARVYYIVVHAFVGTRSVYATQCADFLRVQIHKMCARFVCALKIHWTACCFAKLLPSVRIRLACAGTQQSCISIYRGLEKHVQAATCGQVPRLIAIRQ
jgi:hypothetical protein